MTSTAADHVARGAHPALDLAPAGRSGRGESIYAAIAGSVALAGMGYTEWGRYLRLDHSRNGKRIQTGYAHVDELLVEPGDHVDAGQVIATAGDTGKAQGVHLHFEVYEAGVRVDPAPWMAERA